MKEFNIATSGKLIVIVYATYVCVYICGRCLSSWLEHNSRFLGLGGWGELGCEGQ